MTDTPVKVIVDCETSTTKVIPLSAEEIAQMQKDAEAAALAQAEREAAEAERLAAQESAKAKLAALGLSDEEVAALLG
jgi:hypothetical protein